MPVSAYACSENTVHADHPPHATQYVNLRRRDWLAYSWSAVIMQTPELARMTPFPVCVPPCSCYAILQHSIILKLLCCKLINVART